MISASSWRRRLQVACRAFAIAAVLVPIGGCQKHMLDEKLEELCRKDSGVKVYEAVDLNPAELARLEKYAGSRNHEDYYGPEYRYVDRGENIVGTENDALNGNGRVMRWREEIYRRSDNRLLGESTNYFRTGGDGVLAAQPSQASCSPPVPNLGPMVFRKVN